MRVLVALQVNHYFFHDGPVADTSTLYFNSIGNIALWIMAITVGKMLLDKIQTEKQLAMLEKERVKNELDYLRAQVNPHALFNSLNTIYGYIDRNNIEAREILLQFSELLRYQLYDCSDGKVALEKEIGYLKNYIAFQRLRKEQNLIVCTMMDNIGSGLHIVPLLLVVLIENAFKFVSNLPDKENRVSVEMYTKENVLYSIIFNTKEPLNIKMDGYSSYKGGIGIANLKRRLALLYPGKYEFSANDNGNAYETRLSINLS